MNPVPKTDPERFPKRHALARFVCGHEADSARLLTRREMLVRSALAGGGLALSAGGLAVEARAARRPHHRRRARSVIFVYLGGGPSHVDTFDPKPRLAKEAGRAAPFLEGRVAETRPLMSSPFSFGRYGRGEIAISQLFPSLARQADKLAVVRSLTTPVADHATACRLLHTGHARTGHPALGAWIADALARGDGVPPHVLLGGDGLPPGGWANFEAGPLRPHTAALLHDPDARGRRRARRGDDTGPSTTRRSRRPVQLDPRLVAALGGPAAFFRDVDRYRAAERGRRLEAVLKPVRETAATERLYGMDDPASDTVRFARRCLAARQLVAEGVPFVELLSPAGDGNRWDHHRKLRAGHKKMARSIDRPLAGLLTDLDSRGQLAETLVVCCGEFGRTPWSERRGGRGDHGAAFSAWLAGGGVAGGVTWGRTDEYGFRVVENGVTIADLQTTILHLVGLDAIRLSVPTSDGPLPALQQPGQVVRGILG